MHYSLGGHNFARIFRKRRAGSSYVDGLSGMAHMVLCSVANWLFKPVLKTEVEWGTKSYEEIYSRTSVN